MSAELKLIVFAIAAPAAMALAVAAILQRVLPEKIGQRIALAAALAAGFCAGYWLLGEWTSLMPQRHRQWLPWLAMVSAVVALALRRREGETERPREEHQSLRRSVAPSLILSYVAIAALAIFSAWLLVPTWATLWPPRVVTIPLLAAYLLLLMALLAALPDRLVGKVFVGLLAAAATTVALMIAIAVSLTIGAVALAAAAALGGCAVAARPNYGRGITPVFAVLIGGLAFVGTIEPQKPLPIILLAPAAPLMLWLFAAGPLVKLQGWKTAVLQVGAVLLPLIVALAVIAIGT